MNDFLSFMKQLFGPDAFSRRRGAKADRISLFLDLVRVPLPPLYLGYLTEFGEGDGVLRMADDADPTLERLIELYLLPTDSPDRLIPEQGVVIAVQGLSGGRALVYPSRLEQTNTGPKVAVTFDGKPYNCLARTFRNFIYRKAFSWGRLHSGTPLILGQQNDILQEARRLAIDLGFQCYWFSDEDQACLERSDGAALLVASKSRGTGVWGSFADQKILDQVRTSFVSQLQMRDSTQ